MHLRTWLSTLTLLMGAAHNSEAQAQALSIAAPPRATKVMGTPLSLLVPSPVVVAQPKAPPVAPVQVLLPAPPQGPGGFIPTPPAEIDLEEMADLVQEKLEGKVVGFSLMINEDGKPGLAAPRNYGYAQTAPDGKAQPWTGNHRMQVASMQKTFTAIAALKLLDALDLGPDEKVYPWLPDAFKAHVGDKPAAGWKELTFAQLMRHESGIPQALAEAYAPPPPASRLQAKGVAEAEPEAWPDRTWDGLRELLTLAIEPVSQESVDFEDRTKHDYENRNYSLLRILVPALGSAVPGSVVYGQEVSEVLHPFMHLALLHQYVFEPAGLNPAMCTPNASKPLALLYTRELWAIPGAQGKFDLAECGGATGAFLSSMELAQWLAHLRHDDHYMRPGLRLMMNRRRLGWQQESSYGGIQNEYYTDTQGIFWHGGDLGVPAPGNLGQIMHWGHSCVMTAPGGIEAALLVNSRLPDEDSQGVPACQILVEAFKMVRDGDDGGLTFPGVGGN